MTEEEKDSAIVQKWTKIAKENDDEEAAPGEEPAPKLLMAVRQTTEKQVAIAAGIGRWAARAAKAKEGAAAGGNGDGITPLKVTGGPKDGMPMGKRVSMCGGRGRGAESKPAPSASVAPSSSRMARSDRLAAGDAASLPGRAWSRSLVGRSESRECLGVEG